MWAIALVFHPKSKFSQLPLERRIELVTEDFYNVEGWVKNNADLIHSFEELVPTRSQRYVAIWGKKLDERTEFIGKETYTLENAKALDEMLARSDKLFEVYKKALAELQTEESKGAVMGGEEESLTEAGAI